MFVSAASVSARFFVQEYEEEVAQEREAIINEAMWLAYEMEELCCKCYDLGSNGWRYTCLGMGGHDGLKGCIPFEQGAAGEAKVSPFICN